MLVKNVYSEHIIFKSNHKPTSALNDFQIKCLVKMFRILTWKWKKPSNVHIEQLGQENVFTFCT